MKEIALKPVTIYVPPTIDPVIFKSIEIAEQTIRENNALIEKTLNELIKEINNGTVS